MKGPKANPLKPWGKKSSETLTFVRSFWICTVTFAVILVPRESGLALGLRLLRAIAPQRSLYDVFLR